MFLYFKLQEGRNCASFPALVCFQSLEQSLRTGETKQLLLNEWKSSIDSKSSTWNLGNNNQQKYPLYPFKGYVVLTSDVSVKVVTLSIPLGSLLVYNWGSRQLLWLKHRGDGIKGMIGSGLMFLLFEVRAGNTREYTSLLPLGAPLLWGSLCTWCCLKQEHAQFWGWFSHWEHLSNWAQLLVSNDLIFIWHSCVILKNLRAQVGKEDAIY